MSFFRLFTILIALSVCVSSTGQSLESNEANILAREILSSTLEEEKPLDVPIVFLGTFHFNDAGLDDYKPEYSLDVFSDDVQQQIEDLVERLSSFKPSKIAVERTPERAEQLQAQYEAYLNDEWELEASEVYQIGFRLGKKLGHSKIYCVDAPGSSLQPQVNTREYIRKNRLSRQVANPYVLAYNDLAKAMDQQKTKHSLREHLLLMNHPALLTASHGIYLQRSMSLGIEGEYPGADGFVSKWYNRNLRIFANLHRIVERKGNDRIVAIFGAGHVPLLRQFADSAPEFTLTDVSDVLE